MKKLWKKLTTCAVICAVLLTYGAQCVSAAVDNGALYPITSNEMEGWPQMGDLYSETAVLMDADTGTVLVDKGMDQARYPASITKVMTTYLALENSNLTDQVTFTEEGLARIWEGTNINSQVGETLTMEQCLYVIMIESANEVATQVAIQIAGSEAAFADMMNAKAEELGCKNTHFTNASGLPDDNHYTTAYDMALIFRAALKNEEFKKIIQTKAFNLEPTNLNPETRSFTTHLALFAEAAPEYYADCIGGKTGVTSVAMNTLVTAAERDGKTLVAVVMRSEPGQVCADSIAMYDYGFDNFTKLELNEGSAIVPNGVTVDDLTVQEEEVEGRTLQHYYLGEKEVGTAVKAETTPEATPEAEETPTDGADDMTVSPENDNPMLQHKGFAATVGVLGGLILLGIILIIIKLFTRKRY